MAVTAVIEFRGPVDDDALRGVLTERLLAAHPRFGRRVVPGRWPLRAPYWEDVPVDLGDHLHRLPGERADLPAVVESLLSRPLDLRRPPWECHLVRGPAGDALVVRLHHCIADGIALASVLLNLIDGDSEPPARRPGGQGGVLPRLRTAARLVVAMTGSAIRLLLLPREPRTALTGRPGVTKRSAWTSALPLDEVRAVAAANGGSINDVLLAGTAGALRRYLLAAGNPPEDLRIFVPVNVRAGGTPPQGELGNRFGLLFPQLPVGEPDPLARVREVTRRMAALKVTGQAMATYRLIGLLGTLPPWTQALAGRVLGAKGSAVVTNVPGPRVPVRLAGTDVSRLMYWVPQVGSIGVGLSIFSYAGTVTVGVASDAALVPDPERLVDAMVAEFADLRRAAGLGG